MNDRFTWQCDWRRYYQSVHKQVRSQPTAPTRNHSVAPVPENRQFAIAADDRSGRRQIHWCSHTAIQFNFIDWATVFNWDPTVQLLGCHLGAVS